MITGHNADDINIVSFQNFSVVFVSVRLAFANLLVILGSLHMVAIHVADGDEFAPHLHYALVGASSLFFALAPENERLAGRDPMDPDVVERHADYIARLFVP